MKNAQTKTSGRPVAKKSTSEAFLIKTLLENAPINIMYSDRNFIVRYMNPASAETLKRIEHLLPCKAEEVIGNSIDLFHKNPEKVRRVLSSDQNLPHEITFQLGPEKLRLKAFAVYNEAGERDGQMVSWAVVTEEYWLTQFNAAILKSRMVLEFGLDGTILSANDLFLEVMGYSLEEVKGKKHSALVEANYGRSPEYQEFLTAFGRGEFRQGECKRLGKGGKEVWLVSAYYPILDLNGKPFKIVKVASDVTAQKMINSNYAGQIAAIGKSQAVIEYNMDGTILTANDNFLAIMGYTLEEIKGKHHGMFVEEAYRHSPEYRDFWAKMGRGEYEASQYRRVGKGGKEIWIQASYNPIMDLNGKPFKVVKYATDVTETKRTINAIAGYIDQIGKGEIPEKITESYTGDFTLVRNNLNACIDGLGGLREATAVTQRMAVNDYTQKVDGNYVGIFADLARGINGAQEKIHHLTSSIKKVSQGNLEDLPEYRKIGRRSEHDEVVPALTAMMSNIAALVNDAEMLSKAAVAGALTTRADASKHGGEFRKVVEGVNQTLDAVIGPLQAVAAILDKIAEGDLTVEIKGEYAGDFKKFAESVKTLTLKVHTAIKEIAGNTERLVMASEDLTNVSQQMSANAEETSAQANTVATATQQVSENLHSVATGAEEMTATVQSIASNASEAAKVAGEAVKTAHAANATVAKLGESSAEIGQVIKVITSIAQQTNLLALNATIEAARAGEAGKGFAVVANEVKELAKQTAKATEDISQKINAIQEDTKRAVESIGSITGVINQINDISGTIATAVEEQSATTNEMSRNVTEAAKGSGDISQNVQGMAEAAESTARGAQDTQKSAHALTAMSAQLKGLVEQFKLSEEKDKAPVKNKDSKQRAATAS